MAIQTNYDPLQPPVVNSRSGLSPMGCMFVLLGGSGLLMILVSVLGAVLLTKKNQELSDKRQQQRAWQLPPGQAIDPQVQQEIAKGGVQLKQDQQFAELQDWLEREGTFDDDELPIDEPRFQQAVKQSNAGSLDLLTQLLGGLVIDKDYFTPPLRYWDNRLLSLRWIVPDQEVQAYILSHNGFVSARSICCLWLIKKNEQWHVYDQKDLLEPLSDADYTAISFGLMDGSTYHRFAEKITDLKTPQEVELYVKSAYVEKPFRELANIYAMSRLVELEAWDAVDRLALRTDTQRCACPIYFQAQSAAQRGDYERTLKLFRLLIDRFGWFPGLPELVGDWVPEDTADRELLVNCIVVELFTDEQPLNFLRTINRFPEVLSQIEVHLRQSDDRHSMVASLIEKGNLSDPQLLEQFTHVLQKSPDAVRWKDSIALLQGLSNYHRDQWESSLSGLTIASDRQDSGPSVRYNLNYFQFLLACALLRSSDPAGHLQLLKNPSKVVDYCLSELLFNDKWNDNSTEKNQMIADLLQWIEANEIPIEWPRALPLIHAKLAAADDPEKSLQILLELQRQMCDELKFTTASMSLDDKDSHWLLSKCYQHLSSVLELTGKWDQVEQLLGSPDLAFLLHAKKLNLPCDLATMQRLVEGYEQNHGQDLWSQYYAAQCHYARSQWDDADRLMRHFGAEYAQNMLEDSFAHHAELSPIDSLESLKFQQAEMATRLDQLEPWLRNIQRQDDEPSKEDDSQSYSQSTTADALFYLPIRIDPSVRLEAIRPLISANDLPAEKLFRSRQIGQMVTAGDWEGAWKDCIELSSILSAEDDQRDWLLCLDIGLTTGRLEELDTELLSRDVERIHSVYMAILRNDENAFVKSIQKLREDRRHKYDESQLSSVSQQAIHKLGWTHHCRSLRSDIAPDPPEGLISLVPFGNNLSTTDARQAISQTFLELGVGAEELAADQILLCQGAWKSLDKQQPPTVWLLLNSEANSDVSQLHGCWPGSSWLLAAVNLKGLHTPGGHNSNSESIDLFQKLPDPAGYWESLGKTFDPNPDWGLIYAKTTAERIKDHPLPVNLIPDTESDYYDEQSDWTSSDLGAYDMARSVASGETYYIKLRAMPMIIEMVPAKAIKTADRLSFVTVELLGNSILQPNWKSGHQAILKSYQLYEKQEQ
jgi:hypothetical protein